MKSEDFFTSKRYSPRVTLEESLQMVASPHARPWQREGWSECVLEWLSTLLPGELQLEAINADDLTCVMRFRIGEESVYFKAGYNSREAIVTARLASVFPNLVPEVIAHNPERNWLLTKDAGHYLSRSSSVNQWQASLFALATFHQAEPQLFEGLELPFYPFADLANRGEAFLHDASVLQTWGLTDEQIEGLEQLIPSLYDAFGRVRALGLSACFTHGDAHPKNALTNDASCYWFDWSEAGFAHPFLDAGWFLAWTFLPTKQAVTLERTPRLAGRFWKHYLQARGIENTTITPGEVMRLALLHRALIYHEKFYTWHGATLPRPQYVPYFLRLLLKTINLEKQYKQ
jgi:Phosphotransferase enzyme family